MSWCKWCGTTTFRNAGERDVCHDCKRKEDGIELKWRNRIDGLEARIAELEVKTLSQQQELADRATRILVLEARNFELEAMCAALPHRPELDNVGEIRQQAEECVACSALTADGKQAAVKQWRAAVRAVTDETR